MCWGDREIDFEGSRGQNVSRENDNLGYFSISLTEQFLFKSEFLESLIISIHLENNLSVG